MNLYLVPVSVAGKIYVISAESADMARRVVGWHGVDASAIEPRLLYNNIDCPMTAVLTHVHMKKEVLNATAH